MKLVLAGPWTRLLVFIGDLSFAHLLSFFLLSFQNFVSFERGLVENCRWIAEGLHVSAELLGFFILWFFVTFFFRFFCTLVFGGTFFEILAGLRCSGPWWWRRIGGSSRQFIDLILAPFLIFDLPLIKGRPSLKELFIGSYLYKVKGKSAWKLYCILPLTLILSISGPLFKDLSLADGLVVSFEKVDKEELKKGDNFKSFQDYNSEKFGFKIFSGLSNGRFSLFPDFEFIKKEKKRNLIPYLYIFDHQNKTSGHLKIVNRINLLKLLKKGAKGNPRFNSHFPKLSKAFQENEDNFKKKKFNPKEGNKALFDKETKKEILRLVQASFELGMGNIVGHVYDFGAFLRGFLELRKSFLDLIPIGVLPEVDLIRLGNADFLRFRQTLDDNYPVDRPVMETYIPLESPNAFSLQMSWNKFLPSALSANAFRKAFLANAEWYFDYSDFFKKPRLEAQVTPVYDIDLLNDRDKSQSSREILEEFLFRYYYQKCRRAIKDSDSNLTKGLYFNIMRLSLVIQNDRKKKLFSSLFVNQWTELWNSFQAKDKKYFNI